MAKLEHLARLLFEPDELSFARLLARIVCDFVLLGLADLTLLQTPDEVTGDSVGVRERDEEAACGTGGKKFRGTRDELTSTDQIVLGLHEECATEILALGTLRLDRFAD